MPQLAGVLHFDYRFISTPDNTSGNVPPDAFTATLWDVDGNAPLLNIPVPILFDEYFYRDRSLTDFSSAASVSGNTVNLNVSSIPVGRNVRLSFDLWYVTSGTTGDGFSTDVEVDNVGIRLIPEPVTMGGVIAAVGAASAYLRRRLRRN